MYQLIAMANSLFLIAALSWIAVMLWQARTVIANAFAPISSLEGRKVAARPVSHPQQAASSRQMAYSRAAGRRRLPAGALPHLAARLPLLHVRAA